MCDLYPWEQNQAIQYYSMKPTLSCVMLKPHSFAYVVPVKKKKKLNIEQKNPWTITMNNLEPWSSVF